MKDFSDTRPMGLYEDAIGERNVNYYVDKFEDFDQQEPGLKMSWNWAAFFGGGAWALYRKMYWWFVAWWVVATVVTVFAKIPDARTHQVLIVAVGVFWLAFSIFANSLYHRKIKARIAAAQKSNADASRVTKRLRAGSGVLMWVPIVFGGIPIMGIVAAVALPAYQDYTKRQTMAANSVQASLPQFDLTEFQKVPNSIQAPVPQVEFVPFTGKLDDYQDARKAIEARDYVRAANILRPLASGGDARAQGSLGVMYYRGDGVLQDFVEAVRWYRLAAEQGNAHAQLNLGLSYSFGEGVAMDYVHGHMWLNLAAASGDVDGAKGRDAVVTFMTPKQIDQAQQMARACQQRNFKGCD